jgi:Flp pilus assembly pilin Flp
MSTLIGRAWLRLLSATERESGQAVTEYALVLVLIAGIAVALLQTGVAATIVKKITDAIGSF